MIKCSLKRMEEIVELYGHDWSNLDISGLILDGTTSNSFYDMTKIILPEDKEFFQKQKNRVFTKVRFPAMDYRKYNLESIILHSPQFEDKAILPSNFFQEICSERSQDIKMPNMDYSNFNFNRVDLVGVIFPESSIFPKDRELFQNIWDRNLDFSKLPKLDFTLYNLKGVSFSYAVIHKNSKLPKNFFQVIKDKSVEGTYLPEVNYSDFNFKGAKINSVKFPIDSKLPKDRELFQNIHSKDVYCATLPRGDYSKYNFEGVSIEYAEYTSDSKFPEYKDFLRDIYRGFVTHSMDEKALGSVSFPLTENILKNIHNYNLDGVCINLKDYSENISKDQLSIIRTKYKDLIGKTIFLPKMSLMKDTKEIKDNLIFNI